MQNKNTKRYWASSNTKYLKTLPDEALLKGSRPHRDNTEALQKLVDKEIKRRGLH